MNSLEAGPRVAPATVSDVPTAAYPLGRWTLFTNPFVKRSQPPVAPPAPVQAELVLELVKPVRNDLSDSDLELVPARGPAAAAGPGARTVSVPAAGVGAATFGPAATPVPELVVASAESHGERRGTDLAAWGQVRDQLFGAGKS